MNEFKIKNGVIVKNKVLVDNNTLTTTSINPTVISSEPSTKYASGKYLIQATRGSLRQITELLVVHDGITAYAAEYGTILTDPATTLFSTEVDINSGNMRVLVTSTSADSTSFVASFTLIGV